MGNNPIQTLLGNLLLQNPTVAASGIPTISITTPMAGGGTSTITISPDVNVSRVPSTGDVFSTLEKALPALNGGRITISSPLGHPVVIAVPRTGLSTADAQSLLTALRGMVATAESSMGGVHAETQPPSVLTMGSQTVFSQASHAASPGLAAGTMPAPAALFSHAPAAALVSAGEIVFNGHQTLYGTDAEGAQAQRATSASAPAFSGPATVRAPASESVRIPEVAREILSNLGLLPPGVGTEEALPRLQEVIRLWTSGAAQGGELPAHVAEIVNNFLTSAVMTNALAGSQAPATALRDGRPAEPQKGAFGSMASGLFGDAGRAASASAPLTKSQIAAAVINALNAMPTLLPSAGATLRSPAANPAGDALAPSSVHSAMPASGGEKQGAQTRSEAVRGDVLTVRADAIDRSALDANKQIRLRGDEQRERSDTLSDELETQRAPHDQDHGNPDEADTHAVEALWNQLHSDLQRAGFVAATGSLRPLEFSEEGRQVIGLIGTRLPEGWDLIDGLALVDARMGLSPEAGAVNNALYRLASYRKTWKNDKVRAVLEPLHDAFVALELVANEVISVSESEIALEDLKGFQTQAAAAQMFLDHPRWMARIGEEEDRQEIARILPDVEELLERAADLLPMSLVPVYFKAPEAVSLLN